MCVCLCSSLNTLLNWCITFNIQFLYLVRAFFVLISTNTWNRHGWPFDLDLYPVTIDDIVTKSGNACFINMSYLFCKQKKLRRENNPNELCKTQKIRSFPRLLYLKIMFKCLYRQNHVQELHVLKVFSLSISVFCRVSVFHCPKLGYFHIILPF